MVSIFFSPLFEAILRFHGFRPFFQMYFRSGLIRGFCTGLNLATGGQIFHLSFFVFDEPKELFERLTFLGQ